MQNHGPHPFRPKLTRVGPLGQDLGPFLLRLQSNWQGGYSPPQVDRICLWVEYSQIPIYPIFYLRKGDYTQIFLGPSEWELLSGMIALPGSNRSDKLAVALVATTQHERSAPVLLIVDFQLKRLLEGFISRPQVRLKSSPLARRLRACFTFTIILRKCSACTSVLVPNHRNSSSLVHGAWTAHLAGIPVPLAACNRGCQFCCSVCVVFVGIMIGTTLGIISMHILRSSGSSRSGLMS